MWTGYSRSVTASGPGTSKRCCASGCASCPTRSPEDEFAGYRYELSVLQAEFSLTQMLDRPVSGRIFFEQILHDDLDIGRPEQIGLVFDRRIIRKGRHRTPSRFRTRVITEGVVATLHVDYKNAKVKQYHKEGRALRTETTINDTRDFGLSKRLTNLPALRQIGFSANRRLLGVQRLSHDPIRGAQAFADLTAPLVTDAGARIPGLRSVTRAFTPCSKPCSSTGCYRTVSPTVSCAPSSRPSSGRHPRTSPPGR
jgi:hypothetical protein